MRSAVALLALAPGTASAHVKWFCAYDVAAQPLAIGSFVNLVFAALVLVSLGGLLLGSLVDTTGLGRLITQALDFVCASIRTRTDALMRAGYATFFVSIFSLGNIILTPELVTTAGWIKWLQLAIAVGLLFRRTLVGSALGMVLLFALGLHDYGLFHMMDYPIFLGSAAYFAMLGLGLAAIGSGRFALRPLDVLRWGTAITLMWASAEKWAYPEWTYPLLLSHPEMALNLDPHFYMQSAGLVEFGLAFALVCPPLVRRVASIVLTSMFLGAILEFGRIDAIGHLPIVVILFTIAADNHRPARQPLVLVPAGYFAALTATIALYYGAHFLLFGASAV